MKFVTLEEARTATGLKLVVAASLPSPWSEAVLLAPGEPIRTHWTEILETVERLGPTGAARLSFRNRRRTA